MQHNDHVLGQTPVQVFLREYWQQKPLLIRNALPGYTCPISAHEMAGLACEADIDSRIILECDGDYPWQCRHGPFDEVDFRHLPDANWTLLLQACNIHIPAMAQLLERFRFIPNWRVDDIMMSYAPENGSVGPHTDNYDVFLLQAQGRRRWQISTLEYKDDDFIPDLELKILNSFKAQQTWILEPGDMLYLPPGVAHHGIALDECITISVGFRAPNLVELSTALLDHGLAASSTNLTQQFYQDPDLPLQENPGEITRQSLERISKILSQELLAQLRQADWFGQYITDTPTVEPPEPRDPPIDREECLRLTTIYPIVRNEIYKLAFFQGEHDRIHFYCNGNVEIHSKKIKPIIALICNNRSFSFSLLKDTLKNQASQVFFCDLINQGYLLFAEEVFAEQDECDVQKLDEDRGHE